jgi:Na+/H+-dicarboxylate symporter
MDTIPDIGVTATNVTADMAAVTIVGKDSHPEKQSEISDEIVVQNINESS